MNGPVSMIRHWFPKRSMRTKLAFSFSVTMVLVLLLVMVLINYFITKSYRETLLRSAEKSCEQARSFLENYLDTMRYVSDLVYYNGELQSALGAENFDGDRSFGEQYREFLKLDTVFAAAELVETVYRVRVYIPDDIFYAQNKKHFAPDSLLADRTDYEELMARMQTEQVAFSAPLEETVVGSTAQVKLLSMFRMIRKTDGSALPIGVEEVSIQVSQLQKVLEKSDITSTGAVYLLDGQGRVISFSGEGDEEQEPLGQLETLPAASVGGWAAQELSGRRYFVNQKQLPLADWRLVSLVPESEIAQQSSNIGSIIFLLSLVAVAAVFTVSVAVSRYYTKRLNRLSSMMQTVRQGSLEADFGEPEPDEIGRLFQSFSFMTKELKKLMEERYQTGKQVKAAQFKALQAQINPHFLYNTLDLINWEAIDHDVPEIAEVAQSLAKFYRISLNRGGQVVTIEQELTHVQAYVLIENRHFDGAITLHIDVPETLRSLATINLILQPFVENAIMHGMAENPSVQECTVSISGRREEDDVVLTVSDDGMGMGEEQLSTMFSTDPAVSHGYGVKNIDSRIRLCFGEAYGLSYRSAPGAGTTVEIRIPALTLEEAEEYIS